MREYGAEERSQPSLPVVTVGEELCVLVEGSGGPHLLSGRCPHRGAPFEHALVCEGLLVCPWHRSVFSVETGRVLSGPSRRDLARHPASELAGPADFDGSTGGDGADA